MSLEKLFTMTEESYPEMVLQDHAKETIDRVLILHECWQEQIQGRQDSTTALITRNGACKMHRITEQPSLFSDVGPERNGTDLSQASDAAVREEVFVSRHRCDSDTKAENIRLESNVNDTKLETEERLTSCAKLFSFVQFCCQF